MLCCSSRPKWDNPGFFSPSAGSGPSGPPNRRKGTNGDDAGTDNRIRFIAVRVRLIAVRVRFNRDNGYEWFRRQGRRAIAMTGSKPSRQRRRADRDSIGLAALCSVQDPTAQADHADHAPAAQSAQRTCQERRRGASRGPSWRGYRTIPSSAEKAGLAHARASDP